MLNNSNVLASEPIPAEIETTVLDEKGNKVATKTTVYGAEYVFIIHPVQVYDTKSKQNITVWESTTAYRQDPASGTTIVAREELQNKGILKTLEDYEQIQNGHDHSARTSPGDEKYSFLDITGSITNKVPLSMGTPGCVNDGSYGCSAGQPKSWIYYPDLNQVKFLGNIQDFTGKIDLARFIIDKNKNMIPIEFKRDKNGQLIPTNLK